MCSVQYLRDFIKERLTAACEEIFSEVQKTIVHYEEEIDRQRRLLDISRKPDTHSHITDLPQQHGCEEEDGPDEQQVYNQERSSSLDQENPQPPQIKEEQEELCSSQQGEQLGLKQEAKGIIIWTDEEWLLDTVRKPEIKLHRIDVPQQHDCEEKEGLTDLQVCNQERHSSLDQDDPEPPQIKEEQEDPEPPQIKEEQEELCSSQEGEQLALKQEPDTFMATLTYEESDHSEAEVKKRRHHRNRSHSQRETIKKSLHCDTCGKPFTYKSHLIAHLRVHTGEKPHSCITCGKKFGQKSDLERHARIHTGEKPYLCNTCGKRFNRKFHLDHHVRIHTGEKPYVCNTCGKRFIQRANLIAHMKTHTGEKPHPCSTCGKQFSHKSALEHHARIHSGEKPFTCSICGKLFIQRTHLKSHMRTHTGEEPYL